MTYEEMFTRYKVAVMRARGRIMELGLEAVAERTNPWLCGPDAVTQAVHAIDTRGPDTVTKFELMNLLYIASKDLALGVSCALQGLPTWEEYMAAGMNA